MKPARSFEHASNVKPRLSNSQALVKELKILNVGCGSGIYTST